MQNKRISFLYLLQEHQEYSVVLFYLIDRAMPVPSSHDVISGSFVPFPFLSRLCASLCSFSSPLCEYTYIIHIVFSNLLIKREGT